MFSLGVFLASMVVSLALTAWAIALAARAVGSRRRGFGAGLAAAGLLLALNIAVLAVGYSMSPEPGTNAVNASLLLLAVHAGAAFVILWRWYDLSLVRALAPFAAWLAAAVAILALYGWAIVPHATEAFAFPPMVKSMAPTLEPGDRFVVNKVTAPRRLDLVAYRAQPTPGFPPAIFCQRLVGLPGERLRFEGGGLFVNDAPVALPPVLAGRCRAALPTFSTPHYVDGQTIELGRDDYFFIGDEPTISADSRVLGPASAESLVGVVDLIYWPPSKMRVVR